MKLSIVQKKIISSVMLQADAPVEKIADEVGCRPHTARYVINQLKNSGILKPVFHVNCYALGLIDFGVYILRGAEERSSHERLLKHLIKRRGIFWIARVGGNFRYAISLLARNPYELDDLFEEIKPEDATTSFERAIAIRLRWTILRPKYLSTHESAVNEFTFDSRVKKVELDREEHRLLTAMNSNPSAGLTELSKVLKTPVSTVAYRLQKLKESGIFVGRVYTLDAAKIGLLRYRILISERTCSAKTREAFFNFCREHQYVVAFLRCTGAWDFELRIEVPDQTDVDEFCQHLYDRFGNSLCHINVLAQYDVLRRDCYPIEWQ